MPLNSEDIISTLIELIEQETSTKGHKNYNKTLCLYRKNLKFKLQEVSEKLYNKAIINIFCIIN